MRANSKIIYTMVSCLLAVPFRAAAKGTENLLRLMYEVFAIAALIVIVGMIIQILNIFIINRALNIVSLVFTLALFATAFFLSGLLLPPFDSYIFFALPLNALLWIVRYLRVDRKKKAKRHTL